MTGGVTSNKLTFTLAVLLHPVASIVSVTETVPAGPGPQSIIISWVPSPVKVPPVTLQSYECPEISGVLYVSLVLPGQLAVFPVITGFGRGLTVIMTLSLLTQTPRVAVSVYVVVTDGLATGFRIFGSLNPETGVQE